MHHTPRSEAAPAQALPREDVEGAIDGEPITLLELAALLLRHRWTILLPTLVLPLIVWLGILMEDRSWTASASFTPQVSPDVSSRLANLAGQFGLDAGPSDGTQSPQFYADLILSRKILGELATDTFMVSTGPAGTPSRPLTLPDLLEIESPRPEVRRAAAAGWLRRRGIEATVARETGVVHATVTTGWPDVSLQIAQRILELVNDFNLETRQTRAAAERQFVEERMRVAREELERTEDSLKEFLEANRDFTGSAELRFESERLRRIVDTRQQVYASLIQAYEQARISEVRNTPVITVVEEPERPILPNSTGFQLRIALALIVGALIGIFLAFGREYLRRQRAAGGMDFHELSEAWREASGDVRWLRKLGRR